jgi:hypothetical protein
MWTHHERYDKCIPSNRVDTPATTEGGGGRMRTDKCISSKRKKPRDAKSPLGRHGTKLVRGDMKPRPIRGNTKSGPGKKHPLTQLGSGHGLNKRSSSGRGALRVV